MNLNFIPQVFYDVIARIIPGSILLWCSYVSYYGYQKCIVHFKELIHNKYEANLLLIIEIIMLGYVLSLVLSGIWVQITKHIEYFKNTLSTPIWNKVDESLEDEVKNTLESVKDYKTKDFQTPSVSIIYDIIRLKMPNVGARLVKVRAECHMCSVLLVGWTLLFIINIANFFLKSWWEVVIIEMAFVISIISIFFYLKYLERRFLKGLSNYWVLYKSNI